LLLKMTGATTLSPGNSYIDVRYNRAAGNVTVVTQAAGAGQTQVLRGTIAGVTFAAGDTFGARALSNGDVNVYKNGALVGTVNINTGATPWPASLLAAGGQIGAVAGFNNPLGATNTALFDNFGGGNVVISAAYLPDLYEVGSGKPYATIQSALDTAAANPANNSLVVVYPGQPDLTNPRANPRGAYYENLIITTPVKLQGVGPGGTYANGSVVPGSIIDGGAFAGDTALADAWRAKVAGLTWDGNQTVYEAQTIYVLTHNGQFTAAYKAAIDGFDLRGGDQQGFPNNINQIGGTPTGLPANVITQGGAIFANAYAQYLQITNNVVQNNSGGYGTIRLGTPEIPAPNNSNHNENVLIAHNRIIANGGTNLAGGIALFSGADNYDVSYNDICGNFSAEYGGGLSAYGYSPNGKIHHNRIYFNRSYDEGGGIMIAGELPADPTLLSAGSGPVDIFNNLVQANLANDDGGGIRFLMAGNFPMNIYNNMIVNNVSTHEGGGIALNDSPDVRVYNNTIMKNITTATAITSNGMPAPAGLSTSANSTMLQATLPGGSPLFSNPLLFNNIFWDNRAGTRGGATVTGVGVPGDATPINYWDLGVADGTGLVSPTNTILQIGTGTLASPTNRVSDPTVNAPYDASVAFTPWRTNPNFVGAIMVVAALPPNLMGDYHIPSTSPAVDGAAASKAPVNAPLSDYDNDVRPAGSGFDIGADEIAGGITVTPFPRTAVLDNFDRANNANINVPTANWAGTLGGFRINTNTLQARNGAGPIWWNTTAFGANQEAFITLNTISSAASQQSLILKLSGTGPAAANGAYIEVRYNAGAIQIYTKAPAQALTLRTSISVTLVNGDTLGARALSDGSVSVFRNNVQIGTTNVTSGATPWPTALAQGGGKIGLWFVNTTNTNFARLDNFGGGTMP
jgi:hypothetical protein